MRTSLMVGLSTTLKDELGVWAQSRNLSVAYVVRQAIASYIGYDLDADEQEEAAHRNDRRGRPRIYDSKEARREASRERNKATRTLAKQLLSQHEAQVAARDRAALAASVADK